jgi:ABC-type Fe3+ transport system substrate-binding protein
VVGISIQDMKGGQGMVAIFVLVALVVGPAVAQERWEKEWNELVAAAKREGEVAVMSSAGGSEPRKALTEAFEKKYGIRVEYLSASGSAMVSRLKTERTAGQYLWDIFLGGTSTPMTGLKPDGALDPIEPALILPEVKEGKYWLGGQLEFAEKDRLIFVMLSYSKSALFVNTNLVKIEEIRSLKDLLDPKWRGKILAGDPKVAGPGQATFSFFYAQKDLGPDFIRKLAAQKVHFLRDDRQAVEWLAMGKYPLLVGGSDVDAEPFLKQNLPIRIVNPSQMKEGGYLTAGPGGISLLNRAPHPNAARVYLNWLLSKEGQTIFGNAVGYPSRRLDTPRPTEPWKYPPQKGYWVSYDEPAVFEIKSKLVPLIKEVFGD